MSRGLFPILLTLIILAVIFGLWYAGIQKGCFFRKSINDVSIYRTENCDTLTFRWKDPTYAITSWSSWRSNNDILHIDVNITRGYSRDMVMHIDTSKVRFLDIYGEIIPIKDIPLCK